MSVNLKCYFDVFQFKQLIHTIWSLKDGQMLQAELILHSQYLRVKVLFTIINPYLQRFIKMNTDSGL